MIKLEKDQVLLTEPTYAVKNAGDYASDDLVECYPIAEPDQTVAFYAIFIAEGTYP